MAEKKAAAKPKPEEELVDAWNAIVKSLQALQVDYEKYKQLYMVSRGEIQNLHPLAQRELHRLYHRQKFNFFLEAMARESRGGLDTLLIKGGK